MSLRLKPYPEYKDSGLPWAGEIPSHWELVKTKYLFQERVEKGFPNEPLLAATQTKGVIPKEQYKNRTVVALKDLHLLKLVERGDYVISLRSFQGGVEFAHHRGIISPAYTVLTPRSQARREFFEFFFKSPQFVSSLSLFVTGIRQGQNIDYGRLSRMLLPAPPVEEQVAIGGFLRSASAQIARFIRAKRRLIELLNEQKQAVIHRAVTRGLDTDVWPKPSGIDGVEGIPKRYSRSKLGLLCRSVRDGTHNPPPALKGVHRLLSVRNIVNGRFVTRPDDRTMSPEAFSELQRSYNVEPGDVVIALVGATTGKSAVVENMENVTVQRSIGILRPNREVINPDYLNLVISSGVVQLQIHRIMDKYAAQPGIYLADLNGLQIIYPPAKEQRAVLSEVSRLTTPASDLVARMEREIALVREYRARLIADVVTGKLDVRSVALPTSEETAEFEPLEVAEAADEVPEDREDLAASEESDVAAN